MNKEAAFKLGSYFGRGVLFTGLGSLSGVGAGRYAAGEGNEREGLMAGLGAGALGGLGTSLLVNALSKKGYPLGAFTAGMGYPLAAIGGGLMAGDYVKQKNKSFLKDIIRSIKQKAGEF